MRHEKKLLLANPLPGVLPSIHSPNYNLTNDRASESHDAAFCRARPYLSGLSPSACGIRVSAYSIEQHTSRFSFGCRDFFCACQTRCAREWTPAIGESPAESTCPAAERYEFPLQAFPVGSYSNPMPSSLSVCCLCRIQGKVPFFQIRSAHAKKAADVLIHGPVEL